MARKIFSINTTDGKKFGVGVFSNGEMLKGGSIKYYKTRKGAEKRLKLLKG